LGEKTEEGAEGKKLGKASSSSESAAIIAASFEPRLFFAHC
jgi:hypothetical protein